MRSIISKTILVIFTLLSLTSCFDFDDKIIGNAVIVDNFLDKNPLEGVYIEVEHTENEGDSYYVIGQDTTDEDGYFELNLKFESAIFTIDAWSIAYVYSDIAYSDTLGYFGFQFPENTYSYKTIYIDTLCLSHNVWLKPIIRDLGGLDPDEITIFYQNCNLISASKTAIYSGSISEGQVLDPVEIEMTMSLQHWLNYGTRYLAYATLNKNSEKIGYGDFKLDEFTHTNEGDTLNLYFDVTGE